jgi:quercetin dioxygenase-like cupin family protein
MLAWELRLTRKSREELMRTIAPVAGFALAAVMASGPLLAADQAKPPAPVASGVMQEPLTGDSSREIVAITVVLPPGASTGRHTHPGDQYTVVQEGELRVIVEGFAPKLFKAGEGFHIDPGVVHENQNASTERKARTTEFFIVAKGKPRTTPAN